MQYNEISSISPGVQIQVNALQILPHKGCSQDCSLRGERVVRDMLFLGKGLRIMVVPRYLVVVPCGTRGYVERTGQVSGGSAIFLCAVAELR